MNACDLVAALRKICRRDADSARLPAYDKYGDDDGRQRHAPPAMPAKA